MFIVPQRLLMLAFVLDRGWIDSLNSPQVSPAHIEGVELLERRVLTALLATRHHMLSPETVFADDDAYEQSNKTYLLLCEAIESAEVAHAKANDAWMQMRRQHHLTQRADCMHERLQKGRMPRHTYLGYLLLAFIVYLPFVFLLVRVPQHLWRRMNPTRAK